MITTATTTFGPNLIAASTAAAVNWSRNCSWSFVCFSLALCRNRQIASQVGAAALEGSLEQRYVHLPGRNSGFQCQIGRGAGGLAHHEARTGDARGRLAPVSHRRAAAGDKEVFHLERHDHPVGKLVESALAPLKTEIHASGDVRLHRP